MLFVYNGNTDWPILIDSEMMALIIRESTIQRIHGSMALYTKPLIISDKTTFRGRKLFQINSIASVQTLVGYTLPYNLPMPTHNYYCLIFM